MAVYSGDEFGTLTHMKQFSSLDSGWKLDQGAFEPNWFLNKITSRTMLAEANS